MKKRTINDQEAQTIIDAPVYPINPPPECADYGNRTEDESRELVKKIMSKWNKDSK